MNITTNIKNPALSVLIVSTLAFTVCFMVWMMFDVIGILTSNGPTCFHIGLNVYVFTGLMFLLGIAFTFGKDSVFKYIADDYPSNIETISSIVGLAGGWAALCCRSCSAR